MNKFSAAELTTLYSSTHHHTRSVGRDRVDKRSGTGPLTVTLTTTCDFRAQICQFSEPETIHFVRHKR
jgi:hypothetical protein